MNASLPFRDTRVPLDTRVRDLVGRLTLAEKVSLMAQYQAPVPRLGIAPWKQGTEAAHGVSWLGTATTFPQVQGLATTWDPDLIREVGHVVGLEARAFFVRDRAKNGLTLWTPTVDMGRDPRWGRNEECWGEDPVLTGTMAGAYIKGLQGDDPGGPEDGRPRALKAAATLKHFIANNNEYERGTCSISLDPRNLREYYLRPFELCIREAGAQSMMTSYNSVNGVPANLNPHVEDIVRGEWGFNGCIVSDAGDVTGTRREHGWVKTWSRAAADSIRAGVDSITDETLWVHTAIQDALERGELCEADMDRALANVFRVRMRLGEFDPATPWDGIGPGDVDLPAYRELSRKAAQACHVLLENRPLAASGTPLLPLAPAAHNAPGSIAVLGPLADLVFRDWYSGTLPYCITPRQGLAERFGTDSVACATGNPRFRLRAKGFHEDLSLAGSTGPFESYDWGYGNTTFRLPNGKWLGTDDHDLTGNSEEIFGWFTKEVFALKASPEAKGAAAPTGSPESAGLPWAVTLGTWNGSPLVADSHGRLLPAALHDAAQGPVGIAAGTKAQAREEATVLTVVPEGDSLAEALTLARKAHTAVVCIGNHPLINAKETIDRPDLAISPSQEALVKAVHAVNPRTVVVIYGSYPLCSAWIAEHIPAVVHAAHPAQETGRALADILSGDRDPSGRLATTWHHPDVVLPDLLDYDIIRSKRTYQYNEDRVLWPFGHGLSYGTFSWSGAAVEVLDHAVGSPTNPARVRVRVRVTNTGTRPAIDVIQAYVQALDGPVPRPRRQLGAFARCALTPGESRTCTLDLPWRCFERWLPQEERWIMDASAWTIHLASSAADTKIALDLALAAEHPSAIDVQRTVAAAHFDDCCLVVMEWNDKAPRTGAIRARRIDEFAVRPETLPQAWAQYQNLSLVAGAVSVRIVVRGSGSLAFRQGGPKGPVLASWSGEAVDQAVWQTLVLALERPLGPENDLALTVDLGGDLVLATWQLL